MAYDSDVPSGNMPDDYDRVLSRLNDQQSVTRTRVAMLRQTPLFGIGGSVSYSLQTFRQDGDIIEEDPETQKVKRGPASFVAFLEVAKGERLTRIVLPHEVLLMLARQRDSLISQSLRRTARRRAQAMKAAGIAPSTRGLEAARAARARKKAAAKSKP